MRAVLIFAFVKRVVAEGTNRMEEFLHVPESELSNASQETLKYTRRGCSTSWWTSGSYCDRLAEAAAAEKDDASRAWFESWKPLCDAKLWKSGRSMLHVACDISQSNIGDSVLPRATRMAFEFFLGRPKWVLKNVRQTTTTADIDRANAASGVLVGGGGLMYPNNQHSRQTLSGWQWPVHSDHLMAISVPIYLFGVGWNRFRGTFDEFDGFPEKRFKDAFERSMLALVERKNNATIVGLREYYSLRSIADLTPFLVKNMAYQPCATTLLALLNPCLASHPFHHHDQERKHKNKILSVNVANDQATSRYGRDVKAVLAELAKWLDQAAKDGWVLHLTLQDPADTLLINHLKVTLGHVPYFVKRFPHVTNERDWVEVIEYYRSVDVAASTRGHGVMIPFGLHTATISLIAHEKVRSFVEDIGHPEWGVELQPDYRTSSQVSLSQELINLLRYLDENRLKVYEEMLEAQTMLATTTAANMHAFGMNLLRAL